MNTEKQYWNYSDWIKSTIKALEQFISSAIQVPHGYRQSDYTRVAYTDLNNYSKSHLTKRPLNTS